jgi:cytoskeletal protein RodZ
VWIAVWLFASVVCVAVLAVTVLVWIVQPSLEIARAGKQFQDEVASLAGDISRGTARASDRTARLQPSSETGDR